MTALAWALAECALTGWMVTAWAKEHRQLPPDALQSTVAMSRAVVALIMGDRPDAAQYLDMLRNADVRHWTKVAKDTEDRSRAALQSVDADNVDVNDVRDHVTHLQTDGVSRLRRRRAGGSSLADKWLVSCSPAPGGRAPPKERVRETTQRMKLICPRRGEVRGCRRNCGEQVG